MRQDDDDTDRDISENECEAAGVSTLSSDIKEENLFKQQEVIHLDQAPCDTTIRTTRVPLATKTHRTDTVIACTSLPNLGHAAGAIALPSFKC
jgi:hypothetical protein